jgi:hypothetical protein
MEEKYMKKQKEKINILQAESLEAVHTHTHTHRHFKE